MKIFGILIFCVLIFNSSAELRKSYKNYKVVELKIQNEEQLKALQDIDGQSGMIFMDPPVQVNMKTELVLPPGMFPVFEDLAEELEISFEITSDDLQSAIDDEKPSKRRKDGFALDQFNELEDIYQFLEDLQLAHADKATLITIGESYEKRPLKVMKISSDDKNPAIFIEANIHAREWNSSATAVWLINEILTTSDEGVRSVVDGITWYFLPVTNPDGYKYTHDVDRLWRKTRSIHNVFCRGADPNRNFGFNWRMGGSSKVACTDTYSGPSAFSEPETKALMDFYRTISHKVEAYIAFHCAAETLLYPMGHTSSRDLVPNVNDLIQIGQAAVEALREKHGTSYGFGNVVEALYVASGSSPDHAYGIFGTKIAYTYEFRAGRGTASRFILPEDEIVPNSEEILDSLLGLVSKAKELGYFVKET